MRWQTGAVQVVLASCNLPISLYHPLPCRIYRETPAGVAASEEDSQEGQEETWELLLDDMPRFRLFMSTAKKSKVPCAYLTTLHTHRGAFMLLATAASVSVLSTCNVWLAGEETMTGHLEDVMEEMEEAEAEEKRRVERVEKENEEQKRREEQKKVGRVSSRVQANALVEAEKARLEVSLGRTQPCSAYMIH